MKAMDSNERRKGSYRLRPCEILEVLSTKVPWGYENDDKWNRIIRVVPGLHVLVNLWSSCIAATRGSPK